ncbi:MAG: S9 family peptidase [Snowella sp.]|nr:S9 family peptidase [Snowella sp.]
MTNIQIAPFGSWKSPITADAILAGSIGLGVVAIDGDTLYWLEGRPAEKGRNVLVKRDSQGTVTDITLAPLNVRTRVHEYGGGSFLIVNQTIYFVNFADQQIYIQALNSEPQKLTSDSQKRFADFILDSSRNRLIAVCEDHSQNNHEPENLLVTINLKTGEINPLVSGSDFYSSPRLSPDRKQLAWITWEHPNLPWDSTQLWLADVTETGELSNIHCIAGQSEIESINEPKWSPDGVLYFSSDRSNWWNLYRYGQGNIEPLYLMDAEFAYPHWVFGLSTYTFTNAENLICTYTQNGRWYLAEINLKTKEFTPIETPYSNIASLQSNGEIALFIGSSPTESSAVVSLDLQTKQWTVLKRSSELAIDPSYLSIPKTISFPTENGLIAHAWYYPPTNPDYQAPDGDLPPLLVKSHGGPTAAAANSLSLKIQYWTSRGFAYLDVNYGGSTGYGREYRQRLDHQWGIVDVDDCVNGAKFLVQQGKADPNKLAISGGSAGGYTTLAALTFRNTFKAGASHYGVSDLTALATDTHKFEARYLDRLIGKYPEEAELYQARSPINFTEQLACPVVFFQGLEDKVVPPNQAERMVEALKQKGLPVAYVPFAEEQHGFRIAANIKRALEGELYFYSRIFGFSLADEVETLDILNL